MADRMVSAVEALKRSLPAMDKAEVPSNLHAAAFPEVIKLFAGEATPPATREPDGAVESQSKTATGFEKLAQRIGVAADVLAEVFQVEDGKLQLLVPAKKVASSKKDGAAEIAVLVAVGRQGLDLDEEWTPVAEVREWAQEFKRYDEKHFGEHLQGADGVLTILGKGAQRRLRVKWNERDQLRELILRVVQRE